LRHFAFSGAHLRKNDIRYVAAMPQQVHNMKSFISKILVAVFGVALATAPLTASAASFGIGINVGGPGYNVHAGYVNPGGPCYGCGRPAPPPPPRYGRHRFGWAPAPAPVYYDDYHGWAPGGFQGYYWHSRWFSHRRWGNGVWIYF
jgi:hypothetical protein